MIGPFVNAAAVFVGGVVGAALGNGIPERLRTGLPLTFGLASMGMGVVMLARVAHLPTMVLALLVGAIIGELLYVEHYVSRAGEAVNRFIGRFAPQPKGLSAEEFNNKFVAILVLFCASGTGIFGAMNEGITGDPSILLAKSSLDLVTSAIFATALGFAVATIFIPQLVILLALAYGAVFIVPLTTPEMNADFSAVGGALMLATGLRICEIKSFAIANLLPALVVAMPISYLWSKVF